MADLVDDARSNRHRKRTAPSQSEEERQASRTRTDHRDSAKTPRQVTQDSPEMYEAECTSDYYTGRFIQWRELLDSMTPLLFITVQPRPPQQLTADCDVRCIHLIYLRFIDGDGNNVSRESPIVNDFFSSSAHDSNEQLLQAISNCLYTNFQEPLRCFGGRFLLFALRTPLHPHWHHLYAPAVNEAKMEDDGMVQRANDLIEALQAKLTGASIGKRNADRMEMKLTALRSTLAFHQSEVTLSPDVTHFAVRVLTVNDAPSS